MQGRRHWIVIRHTLRREQWVPGSGGRGAEWHRRVGVRIPHTHNLHTHSCVPEFFFEKSQKSRHMCARGEQDVNEGLLPPDARVLSFIHIQKPARPKSNHTEFSPSRHTSYTLKNPYSSTRSPIPRDNWVAVGITEYGMVLRR